MLVVVLLVVIATRHDKEDKVTTIDESKDAFCSWLEQASVYDMQKMLITALVNINPEFYKIDVNVTSVDFQSRMKILFENLPKDLRVGIYPDEELLLDYIQGSIEENPYLTPLHQKRENMYSYFRDTFSKGHLFEFEKFCEVMFLKKNEIDKLGENVDTIFNQDGDKKVNYKAIHDEMYYVEYKLTPHLLESYYEQPNKASQIISTIYENLITLQNHLRKVNPFAFGKVSGDVLGNIDGECIVVFEFPKPYELPLAKYGAIYINHEKMACQYFTLEYSLNDKFILGSMIKGRHYNYGQCENMSKEEFIHEVCKKVSADESKLQPRNEMRRKYMIEMNDITFRDTLNNASYLVVCFYDFNEPSQKFVPILDQLSQEYYDKFPVGVYDVYGGFENSSVSSEYEISALPTLLFFKKGELVDRIVGVCSSGKLRVLFDKLLTERQASKN